MNKRAFIITVRSRSSRLPEKCYRSIIPGKTLIEYIIERCLFYKKYDIILATTTNEEDDFLIEISNYYKIKYFRGSENDKISRLVGAAEKYNVKTLICCDGDDPFIDLEIGDNCADCLEKRNVCIVEAINVPCGSFTYAINIESLKRIQSIYDTSKSEMMISFFKHDEDTQIFKHDPKLKYENIDINNIRITIDYLEDIVMARKLAKILKEKGLIGNAQEIINLYKKYPNIFSINKDKQIEFRNNQKSIIESYSLK